MEYQKPLEHFELGEFKSELFSKIADHQTVDQKRVKITGLLKAVLTKIEREQ